MNLVLRSFGLALLMVLSTTLPMGVSTLNDTETIDFTSARSLACSGDICLNEALPNPNGADDATWPGGEWIEIHNSGTSTVATRLRKHCTSIPQASLGTMLQTHQLGRLNLMNTWLSLETDRQTSILPTPMTSSASTLTEEYNWTKQHGPAQHPVSVTKKITPRLLLTGFQPAALAPVQ
jgi:hypothetical protein